MTTAGAHDADVQLVLEYLGLTEAGRLDEARAYLSAGVRHTVPGGRQFAELGEWSRYLRSRMTRVRKRDHRVDVCRSGGGDVVIYVRGLLEGETVMGDAFDNVRFVDRFVVSGGAIVDQQVWNDLAVRGVEPPRESPGVRPREWGTVSDQPWDDLLGDDDLAVIERGGYGKKAGMGDSPALLIIDCQYNHIGADAPILEQIGEHPAGGGAAAWAAVRRIQPLLAEFRRQGRPVVYTRYCFTERAAKYDTFAAKRGKNIDRFIDGAPGTRIVQPLAPRDDELVIDKVHASAFYATALLSTLIRMRVDSLVVVGVSTSGCVRATAVDAQSNNFKVTVASDCVADRLTVSHKASLLDLWMKYADVTPSATVLDYLKQLDGTEGD